MLICQYNIHEWPLVVVVYLPWILRQSSGYSSDTVPMSMHDVNMVLRYSILTEPFLAVKLR